MTNQQDPEAVRRRQEARRMLRRIDAMAERAERMRPYLQEREERRLQEQGLRRAVAP